MTAAIIKPEQQLAWIAANQPPVIPAPVPDCCAGYRSMYIEVMASLLYAASYSLAGNTVNNNNRNF